MRVSGPEAVGNGIDFIAKTVASTQSAPSIEKVGNPDKKLIKSLSTDIKAMEDISIRAPAFRPLGSLSRVLASVCTLGKLDFFENCPEMKLIHWFIHAFIHS